MHVFPLEFRCVRAENAHPAATPGALVIGLAPLTIAQLNLRAGYKLNAGVSSKADAEPVAELTIVAAPDLAADACTLSHGAWKALSSALLPLETVYVSGLVPDDTVVRDILAAKLALDGAIMSAKAVARSQVSLSPLLLVLLALWQLVPEDGVFAATTAALVTHALVSVAWGVLRAHFVANLPLFKRLESRWQALYAGDSAAHVQAALSKLTPLQLADECADAARVRQWASAWPRSVPRRALHALVLH
jgi:hypothetical protein